jgi:hypothetical protein
MRSSGSKADKIAFFHEKSLKNKKERLLSRLGKRAARTAFLTAARAAGAAGPLPSSDQKGQRKGQTRKKEQAQHKAWPIEFARHEDPSLFNS